MSNPAANGDTPDLEALFDSIANAAHAAPAPPPPPPPPPAPAANNSNGGDSAELEALFDSVAATTRGQQDEHAPSETATVTPVLTEDSAQSMFAHIGQMTRRLHDSLRELGYDKAIEKAAATIPDARDRLAYVATMTEKAAERTLNSIDIAQPIQDRLSNDAQNLAEKWQRLYANQLSVEEFKQLAASTRDYLQQVPGQVSATNSQLHEIMMAQDFQDLTGQVIKKIVEMAKDIEGQLLDFLIEHTPQDKQHDAHAGLMNGPVINYEGRTDVVSGQQQVDELLESLGF